MKRISKILLLVTALIPMSAAAQYIPTSGQAFHFAPLYNPAFTGIENFVDVKLGHRYQWAAFKESAPQFSNLMVNFRIKQPLDLAQNAIRTSRSDFTNIVPKRKLSYQGLGFNVYNEKIGPFKKYGAGVHYAVHYPLSKKFTIAGGAGAMYENSRLSGEDLYWGENPDLDDEILQRLQEGSISQSMLWVRTGLLMYSNNFYFGATYYPFNTVLTTSEVVFEDQFYKGSAQAGFSVDINEDYTLRPSIIALWQADNSFSMDYMAKIFMQDKAWFGLTYRDIQAGVISGGFNVNTRFSVSYAFEFSLGKLRTFSGGTHELVLAGRLKNHKRENQRTW